jgi:hypothetical protein
LRKVINGRTYNTATSKLIGGNSIHSLYKNTKGAYFLYMGEAKVIDPLSDEEAQAWAKKHLDIVTRERVNLTLDAEIIANLRELSGKNGIPMARMVDRAIVYLYGEQFKELKKAPN